MRTFHDTIRERGENTFPVLVVTSGGSCEFDDLIEARKVYPDLDPFKNTKRFTWAMYSTRDGKDQMRFEDWETERILSQ